MTDPNTKTGSIFYPVHSRLTGLKTFLILQHVLLAGLAKHTFVAFSQYYRLASMKVQRINYKHFVILISVNHDHQFNQRSIKNHAH